MSRLKYHFIIKLSFASERVLKVFKTELLFSPESTADVIPNKASKLLFSCLLRCAHLKGFEKIDLNFDTAIPPIINAASHVDTFRYLLLTV